LTLLKLQDNFTRIKLNSNKCFRKQVVGVLKPEVIFALPGMYPELRAKLIKELVAKSGYIHLDVDYVIQNAV